MKVLRFFGQLTGSVLAFLAERAIHYKIHPFTSVDTVKDALIVAFSFWPGILIAYLSMWIATTLGGEKDVDAPAAGAICSMLWFVYLFRAITLLIHLPGLSNWTEAPAVWIAKSFEWVG